MGQLLLPESTQQVRINNARKWWRDFRNYDGTKWHHKMLEPFGMEIEPLPHSEAYYGRRMDFSTSLRRYCNYYGTQLYGPLGKINRPEKGYFV